MKTSEKFTVYKSGEALESGQITDCEALLVTSDEAEAIRYLKKLPDDGMHYIERTTPSYPYWDNDEQYGRKFLSDILKS